MGRRRSINSEMNVAEKQSSPLAERLNALIVDNDSLRKYLDVSLQAINQYKLGVTRPSIENLCKIADYYQVSVDYLLGRTDTPSTKEDVQIACKTTGLSERAVVALETHSFTVPELNNLLVTPKFWNFLYYLSLYRVQCAAARSRPILAENAENPEDAARYRTEGRKAAEDKDLFLFQMQKLLFSIASDIENGGIETGQHQTLRDEIR